MSAPPKRSTPHGHPTPNASARRPAPHASNAANMRVARPSNLPAAPPVYRPQSKPVVLQAKASAPAPPNAAPKAAPARPAAAPPVYRPQPPPRVLQKKDARPPAPAHAAAVRPTPQAPPVYRPAPAPRVLQRKTAIPHEVPAARLTKASAPSVYNPNATRAAAAVQRAQALPAAVIQPMREDKKKRPLKTTPTPTNKRAKKVTITPTPTPLVGVSKPKPSWFKKYKKKVKKYTGQEGKLRVTQEVHMPVKDTEPSSTQQAVLKKQLKAIKKTKKLPTDKDNIGSIGETDYKRWLKGQRKSVIDLNKVKNKNFDGLDFIIEDPLRPFVQNKLHLTVSGTTYTSHLDAVEKDAEKFLRWLLTKKGKKQIKFRSTLKKFGKEHDIAPLKTLAKFYKEEENLLEKPKFETVDSDMVALVAKAMQYPVPTDIAPTLLRVNKYKGLVSEMPHDTKWYAETHNMSMYRKCQRLTQEQKTDLEDDDYTE